MDIDEMFRGIAGRLLVDFDRIQAQISHAGERGKQREYALTTFLKKYLPRRYSLGTGQIIDCQGQISKQCDIVIYDAFNCPLLLAEEGYQVFPAEAVFGVIEVKSTLDANMILSSAQNIQAVKTLHRKEPIAGIVFAYRSKYKKEPKIQGVANALRRTNNSIPPKERIDLVCVLADGILSHHKGAPDWGKDDEDALVVFLDIRSSILLAFLHHLTSILRERHTFTPNFMDYALKENLVGEFAVLPPTADKEKANKKWRVTISV
jgi:hypothetical protein